MPKINELKYIILAFILFFVAGTILYFSLNFESESEYQYIEEQEQLNPNKLNTNQKIVTEPISVSDGFVDFLETLVLVIPAFIVISLLLGSRRRL